MALNPAFLFSEDLVLERPSHVQKELRKLFVFLERNLRECLEFKETRELLGRAPTTVGLYFCEDIEMRSFQKRFRKLDRTTDILSFPARENAGASATDNFATGESYGDLIVSVSTVERGARRGRRTFEEELVEVLIHGFLHLLGFDHVGQKKKALRMKTLQRQLFQQAIDTIDLEHVRFCSPSASTKSQRSSQSSRRSRR